MRDDKKIVISLIRCGMTESGGKGVLLGWQDEELLETEKIRIKKAVESGQYSAVERVYTSPLLRARETAHIIYKNALPISMTGLEPFDYGAYEENGEKEMTHYRQSRSNELGDRTEQDKKELMYLFTARVNATFKKIVEEIGKTKISSIGIVTHRTVILTIMRRYVVPRSVQRSFRVNYGQGVDVEYAYLSQMAEIVNSPKKRY